MFQTKFVDTIKTGILCSITFFRKSSRLIDNVQKYGRAGHATDNDIIWRMRFACWIAKATNTHSEYVIIIVFPHQQWLHKRASVLRSTYTACLVLSEYIMHIVLPVRYISNFLRSYHFHTKVTTPQIPIYLFIFDFEQPVKRFYCTKLLLVIACFHVFWFSTFCISFLYL